MDFNINQIKPGMRVRLLDDKEIKLMNAIKIPKGTMLDVVLNNGETIKCTFMIYDVIEPLEIFVKRFEIEPEFEPYNSREAAIAALDGATMLYWDTKKRGWSGEVFFDKKDNIFYEMGTKVQTETPKVPAKIQDAFEGELKPKEVQTETTFYGDFTFEKFFDRDVWIKKGA